jgi:hypothetical protein
LIIGCSITKDYVDRKSKNHRRTKFHVWPYGNFFLSASLKPLVSNFPYMMSLVSYKVLRKIVCSFMISIFSHVCPTISDFYMCSSFWYLEVKINKRQIDFFINLLIIWWHPPKKMYDHSIELLIIYSCCGKKIFFYEYTNGHFWFPIHTIFLKTRRY